MRLLFTDAKYLTLHFLMSGGPANYIATSKRYTLKISLLLVTLCVFTSPNQCEAQNNKELLNSIRLIKHRSFQQLINAQATFKCPNDTIFFPKNYINIAAIDSHLPAKQYGTTTYEISAAKLGRFGIKANKTEDFINFFKTVEAADKSDNCNCDGTSAMVKWFYSKISDSLKSYSKRLYNKYKSEIKYFDHKDVIFETIQSSEINSDCQFLENKYVIFLNDRLVSLCETLSTLVLSLTKSSTNTSRPFGLTMPGKIADSILTKPFIKDYFVKDIVNFHFSCSPGYAGLENKVEEFAEYMELFVLAHEYAHALFNHYNKAALPKKLSTKNKERQIWLNKWMSEIQADIYAQNILITKYNSEFPNYENSTLISAGSFYLACAEVLENSLLILRSGRENGYDFKSGEDLQSKKLLDLINPFPISLKAASKYELKTEYNSLIDELMMNSHPSSYLRGWILENAIAKEIKNKPKIRRTGMENLNFAIRMCEILRMFLTSARCDLKHISDSQEK